MSKNVAHVICVIVANELKAIIQIREREIRASHLLREARGQLDEIREDREMLSVRLESTERSRDFLAQKISEAEKALKSSFDEIKVLKMQLHNDDKVSK